LRNARRTIGYWITVEPGRPVSFGYPGKGDHLVFELPARNRSKHTWAHSAAARRKLQETLAGYHQLRALAALEATASAAVSCGQSDGGVVELGPSNRQHNRSAGQALAA
jgi:hypothetical protein